MFVIKISNQRHYYYIRVKGVSDLPSIWMKLSEKGYYKLHNYFDFYNGIYIDVLDRIKNSGFYFNSLDDFLKR